MAKNADVLLIFPFSSPEAGIQKLISRLPPLGLGYIASVLKKHNIKVEILDMNIEKVNLYDYFKQYVGLPRHIGISATTFTLKSSFYIAKICKEIMPHCMVTIGGAHSTVMPDEILNNPFVDFAIRGEGEFSFLELVRGESNKNILGLSYRQNGQIIHNRNRPFINELDQIPFPAYELMPISRYYSSFAFSRKRRVFSIITSRGCPGDCSFCASKTIWGNKVRLRSIKNIIEETAYLIGHFGIKEIYIADDSFTFSVQRVIEFCEEVIKRKLRFSWRCNAIAKGLNKNILKLMKLSGCYLITYGIESADERILKNINKNILLEEAKYIIELTKKTGIDVFSTFMFGNPGETKDTMKKTLNFALSTNIDYAGFNVAYPFPGTPLYKWAKENDFLGLKCGSKHETLRLCLRIPTIEDSAILEEYCKFAHIRFYLRPTYILKHLLKIKPINIKTHLSFIIIILESLFKDIVPKEIKNIFRYLKMRFFGLCC